MSERKQHWLALAYFVLLNIIATYPLITVFHTHFIGDIFSDAYEYAHHIWWIKQAIATGQNPFFQPILAYPDGLTAYWLWSNPFQSFPAWLFAFVMPLPAAYNLSALVHLTLNGWSMYWLTRRLTQQPAAAIVAGSIFTLYPTIHGHLIASHIGLATLWPAVLYIDSLLRLQDNTSRRRIGLTALYFVMALWGSNLHLVFVLFPITLIFVVMRLWQRQWAWLRRSIYAIGLGGMVGLIVVLPATLEQLNSPKPPATGDVAYSADLLAIATPSFYNPLFSNLTYSRTILGGVNNIEGTAYIGLWVSLLVIIGLWTQHNARWWGVLALFTWVLSLGPVLKVLNQPLQVTLDGHTTPIVMPWALLMNLPILSSMRTPARFNFTVGIAVAVIAGYAVAYLWTRIHMGQVFKWGGVVLLIALIGFDYLVWWENGLPSLRITPNLTPPIVETIRNDESIRAVFNIPHAHLLTSKDGMMLQVHHQKPVIAGHITRGTPVSFAKRELLQRTLDPALLHAAEADVVILHRLWMSQDGTLEAHVQAQLGEPIYSDERFIVWRVPTTNDMPNVTVLDFDNAPFTDETRAYVYMPQAGNITLTGTLDGDNIPFVIYTDDDVQQLGIASNTTPIHLTLSLDVGYHTVTIVHQTPCTPPIQPALTCPPIQADVHLNTSGE